MSSLVGNPDCWFSHAKAPSWYCSSEMFVFLFPRLKEEQLNKKLEQALDNLQADHLRESQELINQFNQAQELLKDKISELQIL